MPDTTQLLRETRDRIAPPPDVLGRLERRRRHKENTRRVAAAVVGIAVAVAGITGWFALSGEGEQIPADDRSPDLGIFAPLAGRILSVNEDEEGVAGYEPGPWALDPRGPADATAGPRVADDVVSTLVPLAPKDAIPLGWSGDGTELLFERMHGDLIVQQDLYILHTDGSETLLVQGYGGDATISPDGTRVVFSGECGRPGLCVVDADGGQPAPLAYPSAEDGYAPTFSPDGTRIAYLVHGDDDLTHVWVADVDGSGAREILAAEETRSVGAGGLQWSPAGDRLSFGVRGFDGNGDVSSIYTFAPDGSDFTRAITHGDGPYWSPDGSQIAYTIDCTEGSPDPSCGDGGIVLQLAIADADGSDVRAFGFGTAGPWHPGEPVEVNEPAPTPGESLARANGEVLSFTGVPLETPGDLVAVNPETGEERVLVEDLGVVYSASWSADGRWVAYEAPAPEGIGVWVAGESQEPRLVATGVSVLALSSAGAELATIRLTSPLHTNIAGSTLSTIDPDTGETTDVGSIPEDVGDVTSAPAWSPDRTRFAFGARGGAIYTVDARSGARSLLVRLPGKHLDSVDQIAWSPDGAHIAVLVGAEPGYLYVMDADGSNVRLLLDDWSESGVAWSPDGTRVAYQDGSGAIWVASTDGATPTEIGTPLPPSSAEDTLLSGSDLTWSPDGSQVAFRDIRYLTNGDRTVDVSALEAAGSAETTRIDEITFQSWDGGRYSCECT